MLPNSDACERNKEPILKLLSGLLAQRRAVLELGSGTGQHAVHFARYLPHLIWQPTEQPAYLHDLAARIELEAPANLRPPLSLEVQQPIWPVAPADAVFTANTLHIMSWPQVQQTFQGVARITAADAVFCIYGPFSYHGRHTAPSNERFDAMLRERDPQSGIRDLAALTVLAREVGFNLDADHDLPANNRLLVFERG